MKSENRPGHITKGDVFDDLGLPRSEASALKVKATLLDAILREIGEPNKPLLRVLHRFPSRQSACFLTSARKEFTATAPYSLRQLTDMVLAPHCRTEAGMTISLPRTG